MTTFARPVERRLPRLASRGGVLVPLGGLLLLACLRWVATDIARLDRLGVGAAFGAGLLSVAIVAGWRPGAIRWRATPAGLLGGGVLVLLAFITRPVPQLWVPAAPFLPWATITILVAAAEEAILRGVLWDRLTRRNGALVALLTTTVVFALIHVPVYGWQVLPLDLGVGLLFGGLRLATGGVAAPAIAHALADLATWWL
jgi:membrane protease YdiL (CAAX protease family)